VSQAWHVVSEVTRLRKSYGEAMKSSYQVFAELKVRISPEASKKDRSEIPLSGTCHAVVLNEGGWLAGGE
jgi:hypothetical protein